MSMIREHFIKRTITYNYLVKEVYFRKRNSTSTSLTNNEKTYFDNNGEIISKEDFYLSKSLQRTKRNINDIALSNNWSSFITLTIDTKKYDSSILDIAKKLIHYFERELRKYNCKYLIIPEYHKDKKKLHFHGLLSGDIPLIDSGCVKIKSIKKPLKIDTCIKRNYDLSEAKRVYNLPSWKYGFASVIKVGDSALDNIKLANYITKYITKDLLTIFNKHRFYCSRSIARPRVIRQSYETICDGSPDISLNYGQLISQYHNDYVFVRIYEKPNDIDFAFDEIKKVAVHT